MHQTSNERLRHHPASRQTAGPWVGLLLACLVAYASPAVARAERDQPERPEIIQKMIAHAGADQLNAVERLSFTFIVERGGERVAERSWTWRPRAGEVDHVGQDKVTSYIRPSAKPGAEGELDERVRELDAKFINDSFWLMPAVHLSWAGPEVEMTDHGRAEVAWLDGAVLHRVTVQYPDQGGYTPGDAYDLFIDDDGALRGWHYRRGGAERPTLSTTFEDYQRVGPFRIATDHRNAAGDFRLLFADLQVEPAP